MAHELIEDIEFTIFDTETTGLDPGSGDRIVEIAGVRIRGRERLGTFQSFIDPERQISEAAFAVNKITPQMLKDAPTVRKVLPEFLTFSRGSCLCSYNAGFDLEFLNNELNLIGKGGLKDFMVVDLLKMSRRLIPNLSRYALWFVAETLGIKSKQEHRALSDVELTLDVFYRLKEILCAKGIYDFTHFAQLFSVDPDFLKSVIDQKIASIQEAIGLGAKIKIIYLATTGSQVSEREVVPKEVRHEKNRAYLVGFCNLRKEERTFRIDGILRLEIV
jgi:DNA polymerase III epsilon subunit family exonuclease